MVRPGIAKYKWRAVVPHPAPHAEYDMYEFLRERLTELTEGEIELEYYPAGSVYRSGREHAEMISSGTLVIGRLDSSTLIGLDSNWKIASLPFFWNDAEHLEMIVDGPVFQNAIRSSWERSGLLYKGIWAFPRHLYTTKPVRSLSDLRGLKIRTLEDPVIMDAWAALGAIPTPMPMGELYTSLRTGVVDGAEGSATAYTANRFWEVAPYFTRVGYVLVAVAIQINKDAYEQLPENLQNAVDQALSESVDYVRELYRDWEQRAFDEIKAEGGVVIDVEDLPEWHLRVAEAGVVDSVLQTIDPVLAEEVLKSK